MLGLLPAALTTYVVLAGITNYQLLITNGSLRERRSCAGVG